MEKQAVIAEGITPKDVNNDEKNASVDLEDHPTTRFYKQLLASTPKLPDNDIVPEHNT